MKSYAICEVKSLDGDDDPNGSFEAILSAATLDRDGEIIDAKAFDPLPDRIPIDIDHGMTVATTVGSGVPFYDGDVLKARGVFASTPRAEEIRTLVAEGPVADVLLERACGASLLVVGRRGYGPLPGAVPGSVALQVALHAPCPVLLVPLPDEPAALVHHGAAGTEFACRRQARSAATGAAAGGDPAVGCSRPGRIAAASRLRAGLHRRVPRTDATRYLDRSGGAVARSRGDGGGGGRAAEPHRGHPLDARAVGTEGDARRLLADRDLDGVLLIGTAGQDTLLVAGAEGGALSSALTQVLGAVSAAQQRTLVTGDAIPAESGDARGLSVFYLAVGWVFGGYLGARRVGGDAGGC